MNNGKTIRELSVIELEQVTGGITGGSPSGCGPTTTLPNGHHMKICGGTIYIDGAPAGPSGK